MSEEVVAANAAFYAALEACDLHADGRGVGALRARRGDASRVADAAGLARVEQSWAAIFSNTAFIQFVLADEQCTVAGDTAWVTAEENILQATGEAGESAAESASLRCSRRRGHERLRARRRAAG